MTRPHLIAKLIFAAAGIHFLMHAISSFLFFVFMLPQENFPLKIPFIILKLLFTFAVSLILLFRSDWLIKILVGQNADQFEKISDRWVITGFRMMTCFSGLIIIYSGIDRLFHYVPIIMQGLSSQTSTRTIVIILEELTGWFIGTYLIFGASHYVNWQLRSAAVKQGVKT